MADLSDKCLVEFTRLRIKMNDNYPFFAQLAMYLKPRAAPEIPTMGVDINGNLFINEEFFMAAIKQPKDALFLIAHEIMHLATETCRRVPPVFEQELWNQASDIAINEIIVEAGIGLPTPSLIKPLHKQHIPELAKYSGMATEQIYFDLLKEATNNPQKGQSCSSCEKNHSHSDKGGETQGKFKGAWWDDSADRMSKGGEEEKDAQSQKTREEIKAEWQDRVASAAESARAQGNLPGALGGFCADLMKPQKNWRKELSRYISTLLRGGWTWRKVSRRTSGIVRTPGRLPNPPTAVVYMDTSGSVSEKEMNRALSEIKAIIELCGGKARLLLGDARIYYDGEMTAESLKEIPVQRGGTDFNCVFEAIGDAKPDVLVMFTDLYGPHPDKSPSYPVIWCCYEGNHAPIPWGRLIEIEVSWRQ